MNLEKVVFGFFIVLAATLNFGFFIGDIERPELHNVYELFAALVVSLIATVLKFGDRTQIGAMHLSTSLVADLQLIAAAITWAIAVHVTGVGMTPHVTSSVVSLSGGALFANIVSVIILIAETVMLRRWSPHEQHLLPGAAAHAGAADRADRASMRCRCSA